VIRQAWCSDTYQQKDGTDPRRSRITFHVKGAVLVQVEARQRIELINQILDRLLRHHGADQRAGPPFPPLTAERKLARLMKSLMKSK